MHGYIGYTLNEFSFLIIVVIFALLVILILAYSIAIFKQQVITPKISV